MSVPPSLGVVQPYSIRSGFHGISCFPFRNSLFGEFNEDTFASVFHRRQPVLVLPRYAGDSLRVSRGWWQYSRKTCESAYFSKPADPNDFRYPRCQLYRCGDMVNFELRVMTKRWVGIQKALVFFPPEVPTRGCELIDPLLDGVQ